MKKTKGLICVLVALLMVATIVLAACSHVCGHTCPTCGKCLDPDCKDPACKEKCEGHGDGYIALADYRAYSKNDLDYLRERINRGGVSTTVLASVDAAVTAGKSAIDAAESIADIKSAFDSAKAAMASCIPLANGTFDFTGYSYAQNTELLGILEEFAIATGLTGTTLYAQAGFVMYSDRITLGSENYILGYGFGTLSDGSIKNNMPMESESNNAWKMYYHTYSASDPGHINSSDDKGSETSDFVSYISAGGFTTFMNSEKNGYEWVPALAVSRPTPIGELDDNEMTTTWRVELRTDLKYNTNSSNDRMGSYNNRDVELNDFLTIYKLLLNQKNGWQRGSEFANNEKADGIKGALAYYEATASANTNANGISDADFSGVGLSVVEEDGHWYMDYELLQPVNAFYAMRYCPVDSPIPADFIGAIGGPDNYLKFGKSGTVAEGWSPVDTSLSVGPYTLEAWESGQEIVYKKNPNYVYADTKYSIAGIHFKILPAAKDDPEAAFNEFLAGHLDACSIPSTKLNQYKNDPRTKHSLGSSCFKLNMNALNSEDWDKFFGEDGTVKMTEASGKWIVEPAMSNAHFRQGLSFALNRNQIGDVFGSVGSVDFFAPHYLADPELGTAYNATDAHKTAVAQLYGTVGGVAQTDDAGYNLELARDYFRMAISEMEAQGIYTPGTKANPTVINLEIAWQLPVNKKEEHQYVKQYWENAFNDDSVTGGLYKLNIDFYVGATWTDAYYNKMLIGQFDLGFGSISGDSQNTISNMNILSTNQTISQGFTLNWAIDTNDPDADILVYNGMRWSYDALYKCTETSTVVTAGKIEDKRADVDYGFDVKENSDGSQTITISLRTNNDTELAGHYFGLFGGSAYSGYYVEFDLEDTEGIEALEPVVNGNKTKYVFNVSADIIEELPSTGNQGVDIWIWGTNGAGKPVGKNPAEAGEDDEPFAGCSHSFKDSVVLYQAAARATADGLKVIEIVTVKEGVTEVTFSSKLLIGDELIAMPEWPELTEVDAIGGYRCDALISWDALEALLEGKEYAEEQGVLVYVTYKNLSGQTVTEFFDFYGIQLIDPPAEGPEAGE